MTDMTRKEALAELDKLDAYWTERRWVNQGIGRIWADDRRPCGCFGAHCARALGIESRGPDGQVAYGYESGRARLWVIATKGLQMHRVDYADILINRSDQVGPFGSLEWGRHPGEAWPEISADLRAKAESCD